ncbi:zinc finger protein 385B-like [Limulus polyphemus]|uniref:Zinc finger protein 385B-like n=1 Tax=Limulus polyphemus TaxID=6850 RepID=A0ABM1B312_LIMPO|nr:zinc finger protein 385B-like [Limulus polyphemus]XP_022240800.1 zinc finger protein 385B-like [Limulus polyphemus]XP_022240801.1 zinc finger protein 385B-like [Limulus polyphemus]XP_022240802.1 zinc finger protein 385B-like [Limulus polyphemus]XP_022240804.1 zinc finger protein 385B-like [Limulus polyphemus]XP_022240805.1 zinc finger protein 385B-like [Limulus polyphemus]
MSFTCYSVFFCNICAKQFSGPIPYKIHMESKSHEKMLKTWKLGKEIQSIQQAEGSPDHSVSPLEAYSKDTKSDSEPALEKFQTQPDNIQNCPLTCKYCAVRFSGPECAKQHFESPKHNKKIQSLSLEQSLMTMLRNPGVTQNDKQESKDSCNEVNTDRICNDTDSAAELVNESLQTRSHNFISEFRDCPLICECCAVRFSGPECAKQHFESSRHMKKLKNLALAKSLQKYINQESKDSCNKANADKTCEDTESKCEAVGERLQTRCDNFHIAEHQSWSLACKCCAVSFTGPECAKQHFESPRHCKKIQNLDLAKSLMKMSINSDTTKNENQQSKDTCIEVHTDGIYKDTEYEHTTANEKLQTGSNTFTSEPKDFPLTCECCEVMFTNLRCAKQHFDGIQHKTKLQCLTTEKSLLKLPIYSDPKEINSRKVNTERIHYILEQSPDNKVYHNIPDILLQHSNGHSKKLDKSEIIPGASSNSKQLENHISNAKIKSITRDSDNKKGALLCDICNISHFSSFTEALRHYEGEEHESRKKALLSSYFENHLCSPYKEKKIMDTEVLSTVKMHMTQNEDTEEFYSCVDTPSNNYLIWCPKVDSLADPQAKDCSENLNIFQPNEKFKRK